MTTLPPLPTGATARHGSLGDAEAFTAVSNAVFVDELGMPYFTLADNERMLSSPNVDPAKDVLVVELGDEVVAVTSVHTQDPWERVSIEGFVRPERRGLGIGSHILAWAEHRAAERMAEHPQPEPVLVQHWMNAEGTASQALLEANGYTAERWFHHMEMDLAGPVPERVPLPEGVSIRPIRDGEEMRVGEVSNEAFRDHFGHVETTPEHWRHFMVERDDFDAGLWLVAVDADDTIVGDCLAFITDGRGEVRGLIDDVAVLRPWRGKGLATRLMQESLAALNARGLTMAELFVDGQNPTGAMKVYTRAGMHVARSFASYAKVLEAL